jgi:SAM-dependent methyltransferase
VSRPCPACGAAEPRPFAEKNTHRVVRCGRCATLYTGDAVQKMYDDLYAEENPHYPPFLTKRLDDIVAGFAPSRRTGRLLEVGFGDGELLEAARRAGWIVSGIELARPAVERARRRGIDAIHGALTEAPYEAEFDVVVAAEILEHVSDVRPLLDGIVRVLRPGGLFWATTPHGRGISARILGASWSVVNPPEHVQLFSVGGLRELLRAAGLSEISIAAEGANPHEILQRLRGGKMRPGERIDAAYALNAFFEERRGRRAAKRAINRILSALRLGDSLKVSAVKS